MSKLVTAAAPVALALLAAAPVQAAVPFNAGTGRTPMVAVGTDGVGHVVWQTDEAGDRVGYCRVPKNGTACDGASKLLAFPAGTSANGTGDPQVFAPAPNKVVVVGGCYVCGGGGALNRLYRWTSTDNGASFSEPPEEIADLLDMGGDGAYVDAGDVFVGIGGTRILAAPTALSTTPTEVLAGGHVYSPSVVRVPGQDQLVAAASNLSAVSYSVFSGSLTPATINTAANWSGAQPPSPPVDDDETSLGAGGGGVFLAYTRFIPNNNQIIVQRYDPATKSFGAPAAIEGPDAIDNNSASYTDVAVDDSGPHVIWRTLYDGGRLRYRRSTNGGASYGLPLNIAARDTYIDPQIAVAPDGSGFAAWAGIGASTVRVVALDPQPEPAPTPPPAPPPPPPPTIPPTYTGRTKPVTVSDSRASFTLTVPRSCVFPGQQFKVTLKWKRKKRKGNLFVKVRRADFFLGTRRVRIDKKAPFVHTYRVLVAQAKGSTITLRTRAFIKVKRGKAPTKSLRARVRVCA